MRNTVLCALILGGRAQLHAFTPQRLEHVGLQGAWREQVQFSSGPFAALKDLEFMLVFNHGGTMTESSNYDGLPPVPPAYGIWRRTAATTHEAHYEFYMTNVPAKADALIKGGGFPPAGRGLLSETITIAADGKHYTSKIHYEGKGIDGTASSGDGTGTAERMIFESK